jgi:glycosyltransferase involved in cell wall biosynthesis
MRLLVHGGDTPHELPADLAAHMEAAGWETESLSEPRVRRRRGESWRALSARCTAWSPDLLLALDARAVRLCAAAALRFGLPFAALANGRHPAAQDGCAGALNRWSYGRASAVICVSEFARRRMLRAGIRPRRTEMIPNGIDEGLFRPLDWHEVEAVRSSMPARANRWVVTTAHAPGNAHLEEFLRALRLVFESEPRAHSAVIGTRDARAEGARLARRHGIADRVHFLCADSPSRVAHIVGACDLVLAVGRRPEEDDAESDAAVLEAGLCGIPAVVTSTGEAEAILPGITGLSAPADDIQAIASSIVWLLADDYRRREMGRAARRRAMGCTWSRVAGVYAELFTELTGTRRHRPLEDVFAQAAGGQPGSGA